MSPIIERAPTTLNGRFLDPHAGYAPILLWDISGHRRGASAKVPHGQGLGLGRGSGRLHHNRKKAPKNQWESGRFPV